MFIGITDQSLDVKGRVVLSQRYREELGEKFIVTNGLDPKNKCIQFMSMEQFDRLRSQIRALPVTKANQLGYVLISPAAEVTANAQGRVQIPLALRTRANLTKEVVVLGMDTRIEVWDKASYEAFMAEQMEESYEDALELLRF